MDIKEEGEISLDDVSSSEETNHNNWLKKEKKLDMERKYDKREVDILPQDAVYGKENRQYSNELHVYDTKTKPPVLNDLSKDGLLPISSEEDNGVEIVGRPDTSERAMVIVGPKRKRKKKKKKKTGQRLLVLDDLESAIEPPSLPTRITGDDILTPPSHYESSELHRKYSPPSAKLYRSPVNHFKTTSHHPRAPSPRRRSPRRLSPERSTVISDRYSQHKSSREHSSRRDVTQLLLKKVRQFDNRYKDTSAKDQLLSNKMHILKSDSNSYLKENGDLKNYKAANYDVEEEEDVEKLRRAALETKLQKSERKDIEIIKDSKTESEDNSSLNYNAGDQDVEDLKLRMIALQSAFQKKHRDRVQRGVVGKNKNVNRRDKSPSSDSFLDDLFNDFKELSKESPTAESVDVEDMDLDSDVEREKENQPYSPTDGLSDDKYSEPETVEPSNRVPPNSYSTIPRAEYNAPVPTYNQAFYPQPNQMAHPESPYLPLDSIQPPTIDRYLGADQFNYNASYIRPMPPRIGAVPTSSRAETPYSPTDTPAFDPELPVCPSELSFVDNVTNTTSVSYPKNTYLNNPMLQPHNNGPNYIPLPTELNKQAAPSTTAHLARDPRRAAALSRGVIPISTQPQKITPLEQSSVKLVEKPKEVASADPRIYGIIAASKHKNDDRFEEIMKSLEEYTLEPAYLQGVPQITKDANKIPTLVNRTLVPAPILRTNKQLQQKLPAKKPDDTVEKTFKNAEMQPVEIVNQSKSSSTFKPIKLPSKTRKIQLIDLPVKGFNPINESSTSTDNGLENTSTVDLSKNTETLTTEAEVKKRGRRPKTPTIRKTNAKKSPVKDSSKASNKIIGKKSQENNKEVENPLEEREKVDDGDAKRPRGRPRSRSVHRAEKNEEENKRRDSLHRTVKGKTSKVSETSSKENDNKRRSSVDEDEEALRASVIASMYTSGLKKTRDESSDKTKIDSTRDKSLITSSTVNEKSISTLKNNSMIINNVNSKVPNTKSTIGNVASNTLVNARKRPGTTDVFGPPEKVLKKTTITSKNPLDNLTKNLGAPASPKMSKNVSRVVINLGEDSDSDSDFTDYSSLLPSKRSNVAAPLTDFDKKLDEFLKSQREKLEINSKVLSTSTGNKTAASIAQKTSALSSTPLAVRHLPVSKQEEYRRLKQQLAEKEKQKLIRASKKSSQKSTKAISTSTEESVQVTATNSQVKKTTRSSKPAADSSISTLPPSNDQGVFTNIPQPPKISSSLTPASENLQPITNIYPNNLMDTSLDEEQQLLLPLDFSIKPDPDDFLTITDEPKVDPLIIESVSQNGYNEINYDMALENLGLRENLIIQISNIQDDNIKSQRKVLFAKDLAATEEPTPSAEETTPNTPAAPVLKILTTAQLNMRVGQEPLSTNQEEMEEKVRLDENGQVITQDTQPSNENNNSTNELASQVPPVVPKSEPVSDSSEQHMSIPSIQVTPVTESSTTIPTVSVQANVNSEESAPLLPPKEEPEVEPPIQTPTVIPITPMNIIKSEVEEDLKTYSKLPLEEQKTELLKIENDLVKKRYTILSDVSEMMESLQQWEIERNAKIKLARDVARLRLELKRAEERLEEQKLKVNNMEPKIKKAHSVINVGRSECVKLNKLCEGLGANISGHEYKSPILGADALYNKLKDISNYTQQLFNKKETLNNQKDDIGLKPPTAHKNPTESNGVEKSHSSKQQSAPLNLSVQPTPEVNENLPTVKTEEPENQDLNSATITTPTSDANCIPVVSSESTINVSSITNSTSNNNPTPSVQPNLSVNISHNQETSDEFSLSKVKTEPIDTSETEGLEHTPMEVDTESETTKDTQSIQVTEPIAQIKIERMDDEEINESISICNNTVLKTEKDDTQPEESCGNISSNMSIRVLPSEFLIGQRREEEKTKEGNTDATDKKQTNSTGVSDRAVELSFTVDPGVCKKGTSEIEKRLDDKIQNTEGKSVSDTFPINRLDNEQIQNTEIKTETDPSSSIDLTGSNVNIVGQASERSIKAVVTNVQETWADFEEEKPLVTEVSYESVLTAFNTTRPVDPNGVLCPFELMGTCKDDSCTYNHLNADRKM
ncbi:uncharacterized protein [Chelonus insularis]|uniref:uncharacterized protein isoform X2 n=1 Tax=Chelonus insularis TaxID=460826 RepID=UPI00158B0060|nr:uncharacterized protein LOC118074280 isoform X2 [Chelonus insularis]